MSEKIENIEKKPRIINEKFLEKLVNAPSPTGFEQPAQSVYREYLNDIADKIKTDVMGNVDAVLNLEGNPRIALMAHVDEVGLQVKYIDEKGFIRFHMLGGVDAHLTPGNRVRILTGSKGKILGVIGKKAIHLQKPEERKNVVKLDQQFIDIGATSREEAVKELGIEIGDPIIFEHSYAPLGKGDLVVSRCFDDKIGTFIIAEVIKSLKGTKFEGEVHAVATTQEEIGTRGAITSTYSVNPQVGIAYDVTFATDTPDMKESDIGIVKMGGGPVIVRGPNINPILFNLFVETAKELGIPYQILATPRATGNDARSIQISRSGVATGVIAIPNRYMHSMSEIVNLNDVNMIVELTVAVIQKITKEMSFIPQ
ncbi:M42 family metallopeptidase [Promethearchaeum syntrophicum]|uniref:M42 family metallopeptidase n=1 Tax=Promethearchaeum syntrophicum TaxID=2594042 RepID=A0A5B9D8H7_9ARCH|nr:M42 family metallopeptidase [Candidatus Prometheoarchaeum syntrophicum]QEE15070.1 Tetrahedral aminopeptidase [Candidatus Prometheoarchaeum syntrophicum]